MITSVIGFIWSSDSSDSSSEILEYNGYQFNNVNGKYVLELDNQGFVFDNSPYDVSDINVDDLRIESDKYYIIFDPEDKDLNLEYSIQKLYSILSSLNINVQFACSKEEGCEGDFPIKNCENYAFYLKKKDNAKIYKDNNCLVVEGDNQEISRSVDKINLKLLKVV